MDCKQAFYAGLSGTASEGVVVTPATGGLRAKYIFHLYVRKYSPKQNCLKVCSFAFTANLSVLDLLVLFSLY